MVLLTSLSIVCYFIYHTFLSFVNAISLQAHTPPFLFLSMAKTSAFNPGSPNPSNKRRMLSWKKAGGTPMKDGVTKKKSARKRGRCQPYRQDQMAETFPWPVKMTPPSSSQHSSSSGCRPFVLWESIELPPRAPPKVLNIPGEQDKDPSDPLHPLDHTNHEPATDLVLLSKLKLPSILMMMRTSSVSIREVHNQYELLVQRDHSSMTKTTIAKTHHTSHHRTSMTMPCYILMMNY